jgi:hypothetical protein
MALGPDWLNRQYEKATRDVASWPDWMRREAGVDSLPDEMDDERSMSGDEHRPRDKS